MKNMHVMANLLHAQATLTGTGYYALHLLRAMLRIEGGPQITGVSSPINRRAFHQEHSPRWRQLVWGRPWSRVGARRLEEWLFLEGLIARERPSVFFAPSNFLPLRRVPGVPYVVTIHDMTFFRDASFLPPIRRTYWHAWTHRTVALADRILTVSHDAARDIAKYSKADPSRIHVVYNGAGDDFHVAGDRAGAPARWARLLEKFPQLPSRYVFFLGTLTTHKNVPRLIEALARARATPGCEDMQLVLSGKRGGGYEEVERAIRRHRLGGAVHELGYVSDEYLPALYENARMHILPSFTEGFGLPIVEAMAAGAPVLTSEGGAMAEVAGDAALLFDPRSTASMADALARLWPDKAARAELRRKGTERARRFTWDAAARQTIAVLADAANESRRNARSRR